MGVVGGNIGEFEAPFRLGAPARACLSITESLSNYDGNGDENVTKQ